jgi:hypothetical protein
MELLDIQAKPLQVVKDILDLEPDLESASLACQFVAIKQQLAEIQTHLDESRRISREKDLIIAKLQSAMAPRLRQASGVQTALRPEEKLARARSVQPSEQTAPPETRHATVDRTGLPKEVTDAPALSGEELKLPATPLCPDLVVEAQMSHPEVQANTIGSPAPTTGTSKPLTRKVKTTKPARTHVALEKRDTTQQVGAKRKKRSAGRRQAGPT